MPLVKILATRAAAAAASALHPGWCALWKVDPPILQIVATEVSAMVPDRVLVDVRAKKKADRTETELASISAAMAASLHAHGVAAPVQVRIELFDPAGMYHASTHQPAKM